MLSFEDSTIDVIYTEDKHVLELQNISFFHQKWDRGGTLIVKQPISSTEDNTIISYVIYWRLHFN